MAKDKKDTERFELKLSSEHLAWLNRCADFAGVDRSKLVRRWIVIAYRQMIAYQAAHSLDQDRIPQHATITD